MKPLLKSLGLLLAICAFVSCKEEPVPPVLSTTSISQISVSSAVSGGSITDEGGSPIVTKGICWNTETDPTIDDSKTIEAGGSLSFTSNITQLSPGTTYYVRAYAVNIAGTSYGNSVSFKTLGDKPGLTSNDATEILTTSASLNGSVNPNSLSTTVTFEYGLSTDYGTTSSAVQSPLSGDTNGNVTLNITGLNPGKLYHFRIKAENSLGITYSNDMTFTTLGLIPTSVTKPATNIGVTTVTINGDVNPNFLSTTASFEFGTTNFGNSVAPAQSLVTNGTSQSVGANLTGLLPGTNYYFRVVATNELGTGNGEFLTFTTIDKPVVKTNPISGTTTNTIVSGGAITSDFNAPISERGLCWNTSTNPTISDNKTISVSSAANFSVDISGLTPNTTYYMRAYATNAAGTGYGEEKIFKTYTGTVTDKDGNNYYTVTIGSQVWMAENLRTTHFLNNDPLPNITDNTTWYNLSTPAFCYFNNNQNNPAVIGLLYNWHAIADSRSICPTGWHVSTDAEWEALANSLGGAGTAGGKLKLTGVDYWRSPNTGADNSSGFSAVSGGQRGVDGNFFDGAGAFWSSTPESVTNARDWFLMWNSASLNRYYDKKVDGFNVRCVED